MTRKRHKPHQAAPLVEYKACTFRFNSPVPVNRILTLLKLTPGFKSIALESPGLPPLYDTLALWDTGATSSMITATTAKNLGLIPVGSQHISHAGGSSIANTYIADFYLPNFVRIIGVLVCEWPGIPDDVGAIIGMDIISRGDFSITNAGGQTCMTYRIPSIKAIDYVEEYYKAKYAGTSAYAPCPCGAKDPNGKPIKFIDCHGKPDQ